MKRDSSTSFQRLELHKNTPHFCCIPIQYNC